MNRNRPRKIAFIGDYPPRQARPVAVGEPDAESAGTDALEESLARQMRSSAKAI